MQALTAALLALADAGDGDLQGGDLFADRLHLPLVLAQRLLDALDDLLLFVLPAGGFFAPGGVLPELLSELLILLVQLILLEAEHLEALGEPVALLAQAGQVLLAVDDLEFLAMQRRLDLALLLLGGRQFLAQLQALALEFLHRTAEFVDARPELLDLALLVQEPLVETALAAAGQFTAKGQRFSGLGNQKGAGGQRLAPKRLEGVDQEHPREQGGNALFMAVSHLDQFAQGPSLARRLDRNRRRTGQHETAPAALVAEKIEGAAHRIGIVGDQRLQPLAQRRLHGHFVAPGHLHGIGNHVGEALAKGLLAQQRLDPAGIALEIALELLEGLEARGAAVEFFAAHQQLVLVLLDASAQTGQGLAELLALLAKIRLALAKTGQCRLQRGDQLLGLFVLLPYRDRLAAIAGDPLVESLQAALGLLLQRTHARKIGQQRIERASRFLEIVVERFLPNLQLFEMSLAFGELARLFFEIAVERLAVFQNLRLLAIEIGQTPGDLLALGGDAFLLAAEIVKFLAGELDAPLDALDLCRQLEELLLA